MALGKKHIVLKGYSVPEKFASKIVGRSSTPPERNRLSHGQYLTTQYDALVIAYQQKRAQIAQPITEDLGIYVEITSFPGVQLPLDSLDTRDFKLYSCKQIIENCEAALVFIPEARRQVFLNRLQQYLDPEKDTKKALPKNHNLIASIASLKLADLQSFWTDDPELFPKDDQQIVWWELWLKKRGDEEPQQIAQALAERIGAKLGNTSQTYFDSAVILIRASVTQLEQALELISNLEELRQAKETPDVLINSSPKEQHQWAEDLANRIEVEAGVTTAACILDTGVNYHHPILSMACNQSLAECWNPDWPHYDTYTPLGHFNDHGSKQAGLALFGDLQQAVLCAETIRINHFIESARILPPAGNNDPELYGAITVGAASKLEAERPGWRRVYSLAVTPSAEVVGGQPSSWSSEIDLSAFGFTDGNT